MRKMIVPLVAAVLVVAAMLYQARSTDPVLAEAPAVALGELPGFTSEEVAVSEAERTVLPSDTRFVKRQYTGGDGVTYLVTAVIGGRNRNSVHRPELCLPSQGFQMMEPRDRTVAGVDWHLVTLARREAMPMRFAYTFFNQAGYRTSSHLCRIFRDVWDRSVVGRIDRWVMVTVDTTAADDAAFAAFLERLAGVVK